MPSRTLVVTVGAAAAVMAALVADTEAALAAAAAMMEALEVAMVSRSLGNRNHFLLRFLTKFAVMLVHTICQSS